MNILIDPRTIVSSEEPKLFRGGKPEEDTQKMTEDGYQLLGYSSFNAGDVNIRQAISHGKEIHASAVLFYTQYTNTLSGVLPLTLPDTQTTVVQGMGTAQHGGNIYGSSGWNARYSGSTLYSGSTTATTYGSRTTYIPYNVNRYDYLATYWIKMKPPVLGVFFNDLSPEIRKQINSNKGVIIEAVVKGSPAFSADLLKGDIIKKVNDDEVLDAKFLYDFLPAHAGEKVTFNIIRDEKELSKEIQLNSAYTPSSDTVVQDDKYGNISDKYFVYVNPSANLTKRGQVNLSKIFSSYQKTIKYDKVLLDKEKSNKFSSAELKEEQSEKMREIFKDIENVVVDFGNKNQYKAIYNDKMPKCNEKDISDEIIALLNNQ